MTATEWKSCVDLLRVELKWLRDTHPEREALAEFIQGQLAHAEAETWRAKMSEP